MEESSNMAAKVEYRGGIPELRKTGLTVADAFPEYLSVSSPGFSFKSYKIPYERMTDISLVPEGAKKKNYVLNIEYSSNDFQSCIILTGKEVSSLYASLQEARRKFFQRHPDKVIISPESSSPTLDVSTEIEKLFNLKEKGIITEEEFSTKKTQLLGIE